MKFVLLEEDLNRLFAVHDRTMGDSAVTDIGLDGNERKSVFVENDDVSGKQKEPDHDRRRAWLSAEKGTAELIRLGIKCELEFVQLVALLLKQAWEQFVAQYADFHDIDEAGLKAYVKTNLSDLQARFKLDTSDLFEALQRQQALASQAGYEEVSFNDLCREMMLADLYLVANDSAELCAYSERTAKTHSLLAEEAEEARQAFLMCKGKWLQLLDELGELLLILEHARLENANINREWMVLFGHVYVELQEQAQRLEGFQLRMELLEADPELTQEQLEAMVAQTEAQSRKELEALRLEVMLAPYLKKHPGREPMSADNLAEYHQESKQLLRQLRMMIHPDKLRNHPASDKLTGPQKLQLDALWHQIMKVRAQEVGCSRDQLGGEYRSLAVLEDALATARAILANAGIDTDVQLVIHGETLQAQQQWLETAIERLEWDMATVQVELKTMLDDREVQQRSAMLAVSPEQQERMRDDMHARVEDYHAQADGFETTLAERFDKGGARGQAA